MKQYLLVASLAACLTPLSLLAEEEVLKNDLKSVMMHLDKTQKESAQKIEELEEANKKLMARNKDLDTMIRDLSSSNIQLAKQLSEVKTEMASLEEENKVLEEKLSEVPVREVQTASLAVAPTPSPVVSAPQPTGTSAERITPATLESQSQTEQTPPERFGPEIAEVDFAASIEPEKPAPKPKQKIEATEITSTSAPRAEEPLGDPIPDFSLSGARNSSLNDTEHLSDGTVLLVNINTATARELRLIPGVGPALAEKIINNRPYNSIWDLMKIDGVARKRVGSLAPYVTAD